MAKKKTKRNTTFDPDKKIRSSPTGRARRHSYPKADTSMIPKVKGDKEPSLMVKPEPRPDPEDEEMFEVDEDMDLSWDGEGDHPYLTYPPPRKNLVFRRKWKEFIENIYERDNFRRGHLSQLAILCDLYVDYDELSKFIRVNGFEYTSFGRQGKQIRMYPQVTQRNKILSEIRSYSLALGLVLKKDSSTGTTTEDESWD